MSSKLARRIAVAVAGAVAGASCLTFLGSHPQVTSSNGQKFFNGYYTVVTVADQRKELFQEDLTPEFQNVHGGASAMNSWWATQKRVVVDRVESVTSNSFEFTVWLTYYPVHGSPETEVTKFSLV